MKTLTQDTNIQDLMTRQVKLYSSFFGIVIITDYLPGNVWGIEVSRINDDGSTIPVQWVSADELALIEQGDTVVTVDEDNTVYVGTVTSTKRHHMTAMFSRVAYKFAYRYIVQVLAPEQAAALAVA